MTTPPRTRRRVRNRARTLGVAVAVLAGLAWWGWPRVETSEGLASPEGPPVQRGAPARPPDPTAPPPRGEDARPRAATEVECQLSETLDVYDEVVIDEIDPDTLDVVVRHVPAVHGGYIQFTPRHVDGLGWMHTRRHRPVVVAWIEGACIDLVELEPLPFRWVAGHVAGQIDVGAVAVHGRCARSGRHGFSGALQHDGVFRLQIPVDEPCDLVVRRVFAAQDLTSDPVPIPAGEGDVDGVQLLGPVPAGPGWGLFGVDGGLRVVDLQLDSAAERAGVRTGDLVVAVDGAPTESLDPLEVQGLHGPMALDVVRGDEVLSLAIEGR